MIEKKDCKFINTESTELMDFGIIEAKNHENFEHFENLDHVSESESDSELCESDICIDYSNDSDDYD